MDEIKLETMSVSGGMPAPILGKRTPFAATRAELLALLPLYVLGYLYLHTLSHELPTQTLWLLPFTLLFVAVTEMVYWGKPRLRENWFWLGCLGLTLLGMLLHPAHVRIIDLGETIYEPGGLVWSTAHAFLYLHVFAVWYVLSRGGRFLEGESGRLLPADALNGFVIIPFRHFFLRIRTLWFGLTRLGWRKGKPRTETAIWTAAAALAALGLFCQAAKLLMAADAQFAALLSDLRIPWEKLQNVTIEDVLSLPVGAYLFGLIAGSAREDPSRLRGRGQALVQTLETLRKVPNFIWLLLGGAFCLLYLVFFAVQSRYLFGAFTRTLPEGFIVSQYARQGFFELCQVMTVNFVLLWLLTRMSAIPVRQHKGAWLVCVLLLAESLLFALIAASKLWLYIDNFGITQLRLQSCWGICVLTAGCLCTLWSLCTGRQSLRACLAFSAGSAALLCLF